MQKYDCIVVGCGFAGAVAARELAEKKGKKVLILDARDHVGGNCYDLPDEYGIRIHQYGPHIFHTNSKRVYEYLSRFTEWFSFGHEVVGNVYGKELPIPFNLNTLAMVFGERAPKMEEKLIEETGEVESVAVLDENGKQVYEGFDYKLNPEYDPDKAYISRVERPEWSAVGMLGVLPVYDDGTCKVNGYCTANKDAIATACDRNDRNSYRVIERVKDNIVKIIFK